MEILYMDHEMLVCKKPAGMLAQSAGGSDVVAELSRQLDGTVYPIHRLDREVGGAMLFARSSKAAARLGALVQQHALGKTYLCIAQGCPELPQGQWRDLLFHDSRKNKTYVVQRQRHGVREAVLHYQVLESIACDFGPCTLLRMELETGRTHQIRVQCASRGMPLLGDRKYGGRPGLGMGLWSYALEIPAHHKQAGFRVLCPPPRQAPWDWFSEACYNSPNNTSSPSLPGTNCS